MDIIARMKKALQAFRRKPRKPLPRVVVTRRITYVIPDEDELRLVVKRWLSDENQR